jgi:hypothetical protein
MFRRENIVGILLLGLCVIIGAVMVQAIITGERPDVNLPGWLVWPLGALFIGGIAFGFIRQFLDRRSSGGGHAWPDPMTGEKTLRDRLPGRKQDSGTDAGSR